MENYIGLDLASEVTTYCVMTARGKILKNGLVRTESKDLLELLKKYKSPKTVVFEECTQAGWIYELLCPVSDDVIVCNPNQSSKLLGKNKTDKSDAENLAELARANLLKRVWHGGKKYEELRAALNLYRSLTKNSTALKNQIRAVFRAQGIKVSRSIYKKKNQEAMSSFLGLESQKLRIKFLGEQLDTISELRKRAKENLVNVASKHPFYKQLLEMDGMGPILASIFIAAVGIPHRFRTREQFWSYCGLSIISNETAEYGYSDKKGFHRKRAWSNTSGLTTTYNRSLKYVFKDIAKRLCSTKWKHEYQRLCEKGVSPANARTTLARKAASIALRIAKTGEDYDITKVFKYQPV